MNFFSIPDLIIKGKPMATPRPRAVKQGAHARVYNPTAYTEWLNEAAHQLSTQYEPLKLEPLAGKIDVFISFIFPRPKRLMKKSSKRGRIPMPLKPDLDNLTKATLDACQRAGVLSDDKCVYRMTVIKLYGTFDGVDMCENTHTQISFQTTQKKALDINQAPRD